MKRILAVLFVMASSVSAKSIWIRVTPDSLHDVRHKMEVTYTIAGERYDFTVWTETGKSDTDSVAAYAPSVFRMVGVTLYTKDFGGTLSTASLGGYAMCGGTVSHFSIAKRSLEFSELRISPDPCIYVLPLGALVEKSFVQIRGAPNWSCKKDVVDGCGDPSESWTLVIAPRP